jgi:hypothetical protein
VPDFSVNTPTNAIQISTSVECSRKTAERLRLAALDGLLALPRVGMGIGGLLFGSHRDGRIRILEAVEIPCAHSDGPAFALTAAEIAEAQELATAAGPLTLVGWYCSKTRGPSVLSEQVTGLFRVLCPEAWQILLLLRPSTVENSRAVLFTRNAAGQPVAGPEYDLDPSDQDLVEEQAEEPAEAVTQPVPASVMATPSPGKMPERKSQPAVPKPEPAVSLPTAALPTAPLLIAPLPTVPLPTAPLPRAPFREPELFSPSAALLRRNWLPWALATAILGAGAAAGAWITRDDWLPRPALTLAATDRNGVLSMRWNPEATRGASTGLLSVNDDGDLHSYPLDRPKLDTGRMTYTRKSARVTATLHVGDTRAITVFLDPSPPPAPAAEQPAPVPHRKLPARRAASQIRPGEPAAQ